MGDICKEEDSKNGDWNDEQLKGALRVIDVSSRVLMTSKEFCIPISTLKNHLFGTTIGRKWGKKRVFAPIKEEEIVGFVEKMASIGHPMSLAQLRIKVVDSTQRRPTPWVGCLPWWSWVRWCHIRHPNRSLRVVQMLEIGIARGLCPKNVQSPTTTSQ